MTLVHVAKLLDSDNKMTSEQDMHMHASESGNKTWTKITLTFDIDRKYFTANNPWKSPVLEII